MKLGDVATEQEALITDKTWIKGQKVCLPTNVIFHIQSQVKSYGNNL